MKRVSERSETYVYNGQDMIPRQSASRVHSAGRSGGGGGGSGSMSTHNTSESRSEFEISRLLKDAPPDSIRQTINVEREEEQIIGPLPEGEANVDSMLNFDTISEKVDLGMNDGTAQVSVKVRCERIVPILGVQDMFKKSSVIVTRVIHIDLLATTERRQLYDHIQRKSHAHTTKTVTGGGGGGGSSKRRTGGATSTGHLSTKETFKLYKTFMGMAEADEAGKSRDNIRIDRRIEETTRPELQAENGIDFDGDNDEGGFDTAALEDRLEEQMIQYAMRPPEPDTISFMSALSETEGMMY